MTYGVVFTSRNDGYGNNLEHRTFLSLQNFINHYDEVVYVDWNSPGVTLIDLIKHKLVFKGNFKYIKVTKKDLNAVNNNLLSIPFIEVIGKNVGLRRATSDFILSSSSDILVNLPPDNIENNVVYTAARRNVPQCFYENKTDSALLMNDLMTNYLNFDKAPDAVDVLGNATWDPGDNYSLVVCCGDFLLAHRDVWTRIKGFEEDMIYRYYSDSNIMRKGQIYHTIKKLDLPIFHLNHTSNSRAVHQLNDQQKYGPNFQSTTNNDDWGLASYSFSTEIL
jgi:hypothetical protein